MKQNDKRLRFTHLIHIGIILGIWQVIYMIGIVPRSALPSIVDVLVEFVETLKDGQIVVQSFTSIKVILEGLAISFILALGMAYISLVSKKVEGFLDTITTLFNPLPGVAILPLIMIWFGVGEGAMLAIIVHSVLWPLIVNFKVGFSTIPKTYRKVAENLELASFQMLKDILIYSTIPYIISGLQIGWSRAWRTLISTEMIFGTIGRNGGLGKFIYEQRAFANIEGIFVGIFTITIIGIVVEEGIFKRANQYIQKRWEN